MGRALPSIAISYLVVAATTSALVAAPVLLYVSPTGNDAWSESLLTITAPDQPPQVLKGIAYVGPNVSDLHWLGFISNATVDSRFHLDNIVISIR